MTQQQRLQNLFVPAGPVDVVLDTDAFNELDRRGSDFVLLVLGDGFDQGAGAGLKTRACEKIHFLGLKNNVADYLYCSNAFCLTSIFEGLPISLLEAMACGVIPICTNIGGVPDVVQDGRNGYLSDVTDKDYINELFSISSKIIF